MDPFVGEIKMVGFSFAPRGYAFCNATLMAIHWCLNPFNHKCLKE